MPTELGEVAPVYSCSKPRNVRLHDPEFVITRLAGLVRSQYVWLALVAVMALLQQIITISRLSIRVGVFDAHSGRASVDRRGCPDH